jgi:hypothetical protein
MAAPSKQFRLPAFFLLKCAPRVRTKGYQTGRQQMLNASDLAKYTAAQVANLADVDFYAVRDEGFRRQTAAEKKIARLQKQLAAAQRELAESHEIINAAFAEQRRAA